MEEYNKVEEYTKKELINKWISYLLTNGVVITIIVILFRSRHFLPSFFYHIIGSFFILMELFLISIMFFGSKIQYYFQKNLLEIQMRKLKK